MNTINRLTETENNELSQIISRSLMIDKSKITAYADSNEFVCELIKQLDTGSSKLINFGHIAPETAIAADRAGIETEELLGNSPFTNNIEQLLEQISSDSDILYISNPSKITGANFSLSDIEKAAKKVPKGALIIDEFYFDFFGISALPLIDLYTNIVILRSFTAPFGIYSSDAGYAVACKEFLGKITNNITLRNISPILRKTILATLLSEDAMTARLQEIHDESLRVSTALSNLGVQSRITATDFILLRVSSPKDVGNSVSSVKIMLENLDGYSMMKGYLKYRIESYFTNDRLIGAFKKMPSSYYKVTNFERKPVTISKTGQSTKTPQKENIVSKISGNRVKNRVKSELVNK